MPDLQVKEMAAEGALPGSQEIRDGARQYHGPPSLLQQTAAATFKSLYQYTGLQP